MWRIARKRTRRPYPGGVLLLLADPTGLSSPLGQAVIGAGFLVVIALAVRFFWEHRNRR
ncbi:hypothetical protein [Saccharopolyspora spinosa]|uniref:Uncharacterized protein n=1 Tax=Saccharopolyspora spinosa TaxID=60894 RepID=A0A2N3XWZ2_SACSN|nr:hypothetical protein [Saccharopolyspora spinosa]PKW15193.1 hypothetical protein A8926_2882 [Saccharopolyspora spinosa]